MWWWIIGGVVILSIAYTIDEDSVGTGPGCVPVMMLTCAVIGALVLIGAVLRFGWNLMGG